MRGQLAMYEGQPQSWEGVPRSHQPTELAELLAHHWDDVAEIQRMECDEYPCIVAATLLEESSSCCRQAMERLPEDLERRGGTNIQQGTDGSMRFWVAFGAPEVWSEEEAARTQWRIDQLVEDAINAE